MEGEESVKPLIKQVIPKWYAVYTNPRSEKLAYTRLTDIDVEAYLPLQKTFRQWSDRKKLIEKPLLSSYVFVRIVPLQFSTVFKTPGIVKFVSFEGKPVPIPQKQIDNLKLLIDSDADIEVTTGKLEKGDNVEVTTGSLRGLTGELVKIGRKKKMVVRIDRLDQNIIVTIPVTFLKKI